MNPFGLPKADDYVVNWAIITTWNKTKLESINWFNQNIIWLANFTKL